jgi:hypothetical protein
MVLHVTLGEGVNLTPSSAEFKISNKSKPSLGQHKRLFEHGDSESMVKEVEQGEPNLQPSITESKQI